MKYITTSHDCDLVINGVWIDSAILNYTFNGYNGSLNGFDFIDEKFRHGFLSRIESTYSFSLVGTDFHVNAAARALLDSTGDDTYEENDLIVVNGDGSISTGFHDSSDYNQLCEFLLWHQKLINERAFLGIDPYVAWEIKYMLENLEPVETLTLLNNSGISCLNVFNLGESELFDELNKNGCFEQRIKEALQAKSGMQELTNELKVWLTPHFERFLNQR